MRNRQGMVRVNNFALPGDHDYFENWSLVGSQEVIVSDADLPSGQLSAGRHADDTRAVGLLLYQLLAGRPPDAMKVEPPADGQLHFPRSTPAALCETIARAVIRSHPHHINTIETLDSALRAVANALKPPMPTRVSSTPQPVEIYHSRQPSPIGQARQAEVEDPRGTGKLVTALPVRETGNTGLRIAAYRADGPGPENAFASDAPTTVADVPFKLVAARQAAYQGLETQTRRSPILLLLLLGLVVFVLFFVVGYFTGHLLFFH